LAEESQRLSAVLLLLYCRDGEPHIVFTKRTDKVAVHKGQVSFPGGAAEDYDATLLDTALRETQEEIGVKIDGTSVIARLDDALAWGSNFKMSPFVAFLKEQPVFAPDPFEVAEVFDVPIRHLHEVTPNTGAESASPYPEFRYNGHVIWGATGRILKQFLEKYRAHEIQLPVFSLADQIDGDCASSV
jgi:8-oxo-dGTP pyrophosphatase MutT (NUDIX family)